MMDNDRKFVIIILLQKETHVATCSDMQAHTFCVFTRKHTQVLFKL